MDIARDLVRMLGLVADGKVPIDELYEWLAEHVQEIADSSTSSTRELADQAWIAVGEWQNARRSDADLRTALDNLLARANAVRAVWGVTPIIGDQGSTVAHGHLQFSTRFSVAERPAGERFAAAAAS